MGESYRIECRWCGGAVDGGCGCEASQEIARLTRELDEAREAHADMTASWEKQRTRAEQAEAEANDLRAELGDAVSELQDSEEAWRQVSIRRKQAEAERDDLQRQITEALALTECCSTLREMAAACVEGAAAAAERDRLREALSLAGSAIRCESLHHGPGQRHDSGEPCPVEAKIAALRGEDA